MIQQHSIQTHNDTPQNVYAQATAYQLGMQGTTYKPLLPNALAAIGMMVGVTIADILLLYILVVTTGYLFYILIAIPIIAVIYGIYALIDADLRVYQFEHGLIRAKGEQMDVIRWDSIAYVIQNVRNRGYYYVWGGVIAAALANRNGTPHSVTVQRNDGAVFKFNDRIQHVGKLIQTIQTAVMQFHMPRAIAAYNAGSPVVFGPLTLSQQGLSNERELVPWNEVQSVDIKQGQVLVKRVGKTFRWANINVGQIPNVLVFMSMINYARTGRPY